MTPDEALQRLKEGNARFVEGRLTLDRNLIKRREEINRHGQRPFATILGCSDSRVPPELIFDQGLGELFIVRVAGNIAGPSELGSIEFAVDYLETPLLVVLGHTNCGAMKAAWSGKETPEHVDRLLDTIRPLVEQVRREYPGLAVNDAILMKTEMNIRTSIERIIQASEPVREKADAGRLKVIGAVYDLASGLVEWMSA